MLTLLFAGAILLIYAFGLIPMWWMVAGEITLALITIVKLVEALKIEPITSEYMIRGMSTVMNGNQRYNESEESSSTSVFDETD